VFGIDRGPSQMHLMYVDESGDCGLVNSPTRYFILAGLVVHELRWQGVLNVLADFRRRMRAKFGLLMREEIHAAKLVNDPGPLVRLAKHDRLTIVREFADCLGGMSADLDLIVVILDKSNKPPGYDVFSAAWKILIQRFQNTIANHNFRGPRNADDRGILIADDTDVAKLTGLVRRMRRYNPIPHRPGYGTGTRNLTITHFVEDPSFRSSQHSYFIQAVDLAAWLVLQGLHPCKYMRKKGGRAYLSRLDPICCTVASRGDVRGFVRL
jgi:hypothetical protein